MRSIELFAGAGGMALGTAQAGFHHEAVVEWDKDACDTIRENQSNCFSPVSEWPLFQTDAKTFDYSEIRPGIDLLVAGPPCQPFSLGGKHRSIADNRNMFPEVARAVRELQPRAIMVENVKGLLRSAFAKHFEYILLQLSFPELVRRSDEDWMAHLGRLERYQTKGRHDSLFYRLVFRLVNAADYGVPQQRHRVFIVGFRCDQQRDWSFPDPTHSRESLIWDQFVTGNYWERHRVPLRKRTRPPVLIFRETDIPQGELFAEPPAPWRTVRDATSDLPCPTRNGTLFIANHRLQLGAKKYPGHTGSPLDFPAKALKAGDHGVPGGENMLVYHDGRLRYFTVRESARLQTFPDNYVFRGSWTESMRQVGNAVPVALGRLIAESVRQGLSTKR